MPVLLRDRELRMLAVLLAVTLALGSLVYMVVEGWTLLDAVYFSAEIAAAREKPEHLVRHSIRTIQVKRRRSI